MSYHLVPERYNNAPADLRDVRATRTWQQTARCLNYSISEADLLSSPNIIAEAFAIVSLMLVILASGAGVYFLPLAYIPAVLMGNAGFKVQDGKGGISIDGLIKLIALGGPVAYMAYAYNSDSFTRGESASMFITGMAALFCGFAVAHAIKASNDAGRSLDQAMSESTMDASILLLGMTSVYFGGFFTYIFAAFALYKVFKKWSKDEEKRNAILSASAVASTLMCPQMLCMQLKTPRMSALIRTSEPWKTKLHSSLARLPPVC